ncbi:zinc ribbon domain-containing protein [Woeseia oceani]|uniref:DZANK-type domain-containing protein n=1 Tax=Woeseia oceani TaxID=1548547 RepID=A0A193LDH4_9GAMM|nr:zinc ribbon domain-containing protein [Woeseia oceani]ANO50434.1 hypothetical protein BA177_03720 [Woeseia oceani]
MALVKCKDCDNQVSDSAASCPKCGAPMPRVIRDDQEQCPFCREVMNLGATHCPNCHAQKGYIHNRGRIYGRMETIWYGITMPIILAVVASMMGPVVGAIVWLLCAIPIVVSVYRLLTGAVWFQKTSVY